MSNLQKSQQPQELITRNYNIAQSIIVAMERTKTEPFDIQNMVVDISEEFKRVSVEDIQQGIKAGSLGKYGCSYKFCTQTVCVWIREYLKNKNGKPLLL
jgi:hypothetical protein